MDDAKPTISSDLRVFLDASPDAAAVFDEELQPVYANEAYRVLFLGTPAAPGRHRQQQTAAHELEGDLLVKHWPARQAQQLGTVVQVNEVRTTDAEDSLVFNVTAIPLRGIGVVELFRNVTDEARVHARYRNLLRKERVAKQALEWLVAERTKALESANEELKAAQAQLVHSEKMAGLGQLVAGIAHELNNPINFISANVDFLKEYFDTMTEFVRALETQVARYPDAARHVDEARRRLDVEYVAKDFGSLVKAIRSGAARGARIVADLKSFSRMGHDTWEDTDLTEGIRVSLVLLSPILRDRVTVHQSLEPCTVRCNSGHVNQVFMNVLTNAAQAIQGPGNIWITNRSEDDTIAYEISDDGPGIPPEVLPKIFDPFFTTKPVGQGTGLGLSICYRIIQDHRGTISVVPRPERGTTVRIVLPKKGKPT
ncbi:MAG: PAS domain-containing protein [Deltaproteobacteria bacterium]|nr:PAS domain-containing protein [Deltaproteobacteria bacterium]